MPIGITLTALSGDYKPMDLSWFLGFGVPIGENCQDADAGPRWDNEDAKAKYLSVCLNDSQT